MSNILVLHSLKEKTLYDKLNRLAIEAANKSYSPYSKFKVGAALLTRGGEVIVGTNIENRSYGLTNCAERTAIFTALTMGYTEFEAISIYSPDSKNFLPPCGACRQVLSEFVSEDFIFLLGNSKMEFIEKTMKELLPLDSLFDLKGD